MLLSCARFVNPYTAIMNKFRSRWPIVNSVFFVRCLSLFASCQHKTLKTSMWRSGDSIRVFPRKLQTLPTPSIQVILVLLIKSSDVICWTEYDGYSDSIVFILCCTVAMISQPTSFYSQQNNCVNVGNFQKVKLIPDGAAIFTRGMGMTCVWDSERG